MVCWNPALIAILVPILRISLNETTTSPARVPSVSPSAEIRLGASEAALAPPRFRRRWKLPILLFVATFASTLLVGAWHWQPQVCMASDAVFVRR